MIDALKWFLLIQLVGLISLPLTLSLFQKLPSKGVYLAKPLGLLLWGFVWWWLSSLGVLRNNASSALLSLGLVMFPNLWLLKQRGIKNFWEELLGLKKLLIASEALFLAFFVFWVVVRAANPDIIHTEKFMEMAFINAILKSDAFPPHDPWLSGYGISYYYFGYVISALLIRLTGTASSVGYNLVSALWFGLTALAGYGLLWDLLGRRSGDSDEKPDLPLRNYWLAVLAPVLILIVSNWFGLLDVLHSRGFLTPEALKGFNLPALSVEPYAYNWFPNRGGWSWWQGSRVLQDFRLNGSAIEIIDEFPFFTYLLSDIHPHLLGMPFVLLTIAQALNAWLGGWEKNSRLFGKQIRLSWLHAGMAVVTLGGLAFLNTWDFPFYLLLICFALVWSWSQKDGWNTKRLLQLVLLGLAGGILSLAAYLPFYLSFASQAGGILPSLAFFTHGSSLWIMFGPLLGAILLWLTYRQIRLKRFPGKSALLLALAAVTFLFVLGWGLGWLAGRLEHMDGLINSLQGAENNRHLLLGSLLARLKSPGAFLTLFLLICLALDQLLPGVKADPGIAGSEGTPRPSLNAKGFVLVLILLGALLVLVPEFIYLKDQFSNRMNTIFKFYFQAWILWSLAAAFSISDFMDRDKGLADKLMAGLITVVGLLAFGFSTTKRLEQLTPVFGATWLDYLIILIPLLFIGWLLWHLIRKQYKLAFGVICLACLAAGLVYPTIELWNKTEGFAPRDGYSLDGKQDFYVYSANELAAADWLADAPLGVMAEAVADSGGSYTTYNLVSTFSGMPTVLGWIGHEAQWRGGYEEMGSRQNDLRELYSTASWERAKAVIDQYNIRYIVVGKLERQTYAVDISKFEANLEKVFDTGTVDVYEVKKH